MKNIYKVLILTGMMFGASSCGDEFLNLQPQQSVSNEVFLANITDFETANIGMHNQLQNSDWYGRYRLLVPDVMGEDVKQNASANRAKEWAEYNGNQTDFIPLEFWAEMYEGINIANEIINKDFSPTPATADRYNQVLGAAYAIRALGHFDLVNIFAQHYTFTAGASHPGIPIVTAFEVSAKPARNTVAEVYAQIEADLMQGISLMNVDQPNAGYMSKAGAQALLSRVYLYQEKWAEAEAIATTVINSGDYTLTSKAAYPTMWLDGNSSESIFEIVMTLPDNNGSDHIGGMYKETGYGDYLPSQILFNLYDTLNTDDVRGKAPMFRVDPNLSGVYGSVRVNKWPSDGANIATDNIPIVRLSEVYLNRAEARAQQGNAAGAIADVNMVRDARTDGLSPIGGSGQALIDEILLERRRELAFEGHRIYDATRYKRGIDRSADCTSIPTACNISYPDSRFILPIPQDELSANPQMAQNPDY